MKLAADRQELEAALEQASARLAAGQPPTDDADAEWQRQQQQAATLQELHEQRDQVGWPLHLRWHRRAKPPSGLRRGCTAGHRS
jgi:hypothetical protein